MTSTTAFVLLVLVLLAVLIGLELRRRRSAVPLSGASATVRTRLFGSGSSDPDGSRLERDLSAIAAHGQSPFVR